MATTHSNKENEKEVSIEPVVLNSVKIRYIDKTIEVPNYVPVDIERPNYIDLDFDVPNLVPYDVKVPVPKEIPYDVKVPVPKEVPYDLPVVEMEKVKAVASDVVSVLNEAKNALGKVKHHKITEKEVVVDVPVPKEVPYDLPIVSMEKVNQIASEAVSTLNKAMDMLEGVNAMVKALEAVAGEVDDTLTDIKTKIEGIKNYKIIEEKHTVKVPEYVKQKVRILGKVVSIGDM